MVLVIGAKFGGKNRVVAVEDFLLQAALYLNSNDLSILQVGMQKYQ